MKVKLFWKKNPMTFGFRWDPCGTSDNTGSLEDQINAWLRDHPHIKIADVRQSATGGSWGAQVWSISVWYEEGDS
jgi:hypothetical protein